MKNVRIDVPVSPHVAGVCIAAYIGTVHGSYQTPDPNDPDVKQWLSELPKGRGEALHMVRVQIEAYGTEGQREDVCPLVQREAEALWRKWYP